MIDRMTAEQDERWLGTPFAGSWSAPVGTPSPRITEDVPAPWVRNDAQPTQI